MIYQGMYIFRVGVGVGVFPGWWGVRIDGLNLAATRYDGPGGGRVRNRCGEDM